MKSRNTLNNKFGLQIKNNNGYYSPVNIVQTALISYDIICSEINKIFQMKNELEENELKPINIHLKHKDLKKIIIYNNDEWNFLYNYNIIHECISKNKLRLDYEITDPNKIINEEKRQENSFKIIQYIIKKIPQNFHLEIITKFLNSNKEIGELFKNFFINEIMNISYDEIMKKNKNNEKQKIDKLINNYNENYIYKKENKDYYIKSNEFIEMFNEQILNNNINIINGINNIIEEKNMDNQNIEKNKYKHKINNPKFIINANNILLTKLNKKIENKNYLDENNYFKKLNINEYYCGIEEINDDINRELITILK